MALQVEASQRIAAAPLRAFQVLAEVRGWKGWWPAVRDARTLDGKLLREGSRCEVTLQIGRLSSTMRPRVALFAEGKAIAWEGSWMGVPLRQEWYVEPRPDGCRVVARATFADPAAVLLRLFRLHHRWATMLDEQVRMLKRVAETM
jgi:hypothetical protein